MSTLLHRCPLRFVALLGLSSALLGQEATLVIDAEGDGDAAFLTACDITVDGGGSSYMVGAESDNVFRVDVDGQITELITAEGDGYGNALDQPRSVAVDRFGNVFVAGWASNNVFRIAPDGEVLEILDEFGDGSGRLLQGPLGLSVDSSGAVYVAGSLSDNVFRIGAEGDVRVLLTAEGDGMQASLDGPSDTFVDAAGRVLVSGFLSRNAFAISLSGEQVSGVRCMIDRTGDGRGQTLGAPGSIAADAHGEVFLADAVQDRVFAISSSGVVRVVISGDSEIPFGGPAGLAIDAQGNLLVSYQVFLAEVGTGDSGLRSGVLRIDPFGAVHEVIDAAGDGRGNELFPAHAVAVDARGGVYVTGLGSHNVFRVALGQ